MPFPFMAARHPYRMAPILTVRFRAVAAVHSDGGIYKFDVPESGRAILEAVPVP
jgi:hypothetical protein